VQVLSEAGAAVELVISDTARIVLKEELGIEAGEGDLLPKLGVTNTAKVHLHGFRDFTAPIASGSYPTEGMVIIPCSMGTLGAVASGLSQNLIHRAADCTIKEGRRLILVPRETPLSAIHLENMLKLSRLGVRMVPAMPAFYSGQQSIQELVDFMVGKVLDQMGIPHALYPRWIGPVKGSGIH
jgi:4-hydroxy-3-polyprenylbenzoate decarboxylase